jgi:hypothetical protein
LAASISVHLPVAGGLSYPHYFATGLFVFRGNVASRAESGPHAFPLGALSGFCKAGNFPVMMQYWEVYENFANKSFTTIGNSINFENNEYGT